jgi:hypothetical protein
MLQRHTLSVAQFEMYNVEKIIQEFDAQQVGHLNVTKSIPLACPAEILTLCVEIDINVGH